MSEKYYSSRYLSPKDTKDPTKDFVSCSTDNIHRSTKEKIALCKADVQKNTLSDEEFREYFEGELMQKNIGNCYLVAVINSLRLHTDFKKLIQRSVKKVPDGFELTLPLGAPYPYGKMVKITERDYYPQLTIGSEELMVLDGNEGLKALAIGYGKISTGQGDYDTQLLTGGYEVNVMNTLFHGISGYSRYRKMYSYDKDNKIAWNKKEDVPFVSELKKVLSMFDKNKLMTVSFPINESGVIDDIFDFRKYPEYAYERGHAFTVQSVEKIGNNVRSVTIINPWDSTKHIKIPVEKFLRLVTSYSLGAYNPRIFGITYDNTRDIGNRDTIDENKEKDVKGMGLGQVIDELSGLNLRNHNANIRLFGGEYYIDSFGKTDTRLGSGFWHQNMKAQIETAGGIDQYLYRYKFDQNMSIHNSVMLSHYIRRGNREWDYAKLEHIIYFGKQNINFGTSSPFSNEFQGKQDITFSYTLYPALFATFINECRFYFIKNTREKSTTIVNPFYIDGKGSIRYSARRIANNIEGYMTGEEYGANVMSKWSEIGIKNSDTETKKKIVNLLNNLYYAD